MTRCLSSVLGRCQRDPAVPRGQAMPGGPAVPPLPQPPPSRGAVSPGVPKVPVPAGGCDSDPWGSRFWGGGPGLRGADPWPCVVSPGVSPVFGGASCGMTVSPPGTSRACWTSWNSTTGTPRTTPRWDSESGGDGVSLSPIPGCHLLLEPRWCHPGSPRSAPTLRCHRTLLRVFPAASSRGIPAWIAAVPGPGVPSAVAVPWAGSRTRW